MMESEEERKLRRERAKEISFRRIVDGVRSSWARTAREALGIKAVSPITDMTAEQLRGLTVEQLAERFVAITLEEDKVMFHIPEISRLVKQAMAVTDELKAREGDQRRVLISLYEHPNLQVRLTAAIATRALAPAASRKTIQDIADSELQPQAFDAAMSLSNLDSGRSKPT